MTAPLPITGLSAVADRYDVLLSDVWGVIHDGKAAFPDACAALARFRAERGPVLLLSNAPRPGDDVVKLLDQLGVPREAYDGILTSGDATRAEMTRRGASASFIASGLSKPSGAMSSVASSWAAFLS